MLPLPSGGLHAAAAARRRAGWPAGGGGGVALRSTSWRCIEMKRPGYFVKYSCATKPRLIVDIWNWNFTSVGSSSSKRMS